ncbi:MAG: 50S ribosomal protein L21 [Chloroflexota bacterium]|nr:50S ribosomal protein L21 [Chloroflexota bacterium]MDE2839544.1 50S ribosomal protein L21 [Chloroflexota bacterium]MDE2930547.1 50S ribosomal protein L21 [Chloroflexota bacterium]
MFAVVEIAGKQYRVSPGDRIAVERLDAEPGSEISLDSVLLTSTDDGVTVGTPVIDGASVRAQVVREEKDSKVLVLKYKRKNRYRHLSGHRQTHTVLEIDSIET